MVANNFADGELFTAAHLNSILQAFRGFATQSGGVASKGTGDWDVDVTAGEFLDGTLFPAQTATLTAADATNYRVDLLTLQQSGGTGALNVYEGSDSAGAPAVQDVPTGEVPIAVVELKAGASALTSADIHDVRVRWPANYPWDAGSIKDGAVTTDKLFGAAVTSGKIASGAVIHTKLGALAVKNENIDNSTISAGEKVVDGSVVTSLLGTGAVTNPKLSTDAVSTVKIQNDAVTTDKLGPASVNTTALKDDAVTSAKIDNNTVTRENVKNNEFSEVGWKFIDSVPLPEDGSSTLTAEVLDKTVTGLFNYEIKIIGWVRWAEKEATGGDGLQLRVNGRSVGYAQTDEDGTVSSGNTWWKNLTSIGNQSGVDPSQGEDWGTSFEFTIVSPNTVGTVTENGTIYGRGTSGDPSTDSTLREGYLDPVSGPVEELRFKTDVEVQGNVEIYGRSEIV